MQNNNLKNIVKGLLAALVIVIVWFTHSQNVQSPNLGAISVVPTPVALFETTLSNSITSTATTFTLTSATDKDGNTLATSTYAFIIDEGTANEEFVTAECVGTSCTNAQRGLSVVNGTAEVTANKKAHRRGASVKITDGPQLLILSRLANGTIGYENPLKYSGVSTSTIGLDGNNIASVAYANSLSFGTIAAAAEAVAGFVELATGQEAASSTLSGSFARLVLPTSISTSTAPASGHVIPVTGIDGNISEGFIPDTFSGNKTFTGTVTFAGTTTINFYTASTTYSKPSNLSHIVVEVQGGGGGGGGSTNTNEAAGGGGAGAYAREVILASELSATTSVVVGSGGATSGTTSGSAGGTSSFGSFLSASGGGGGVDSGSGGTGGSGGTATGGDININGGAGAYSDNPGGTDEIRLGGRGANSRFGNGGHSYITLTNQRNLGNAGTGYGSGGSGAANDTTNDTSGGVGAQGFVIITEYYN